MPQSRKRRRRETNTRPNANSPKSPISRVAKQLKIDDLFLNDLISDLVPTSNSFSPLETLDVQNVTPTQTQLPSFDLEGTLQDETSGLLSPSCPAIGTTASHFGEVPDHEYISKSEILKMISEHCFIMTDTVIICF